MDVHIVERAIKAANFIISNNATLREAEKWLGVSRSTIDRDITIRLIKVNPALAEQAIAVLQANRDYNRANIKEIRKAFLKEVSI